MLADRSRTELNKMPALMAGAVLTLLSYSALIGWRLFISSTPLDVPVEDPIARAVTLVLIYAPWLYWLFCVKKLHDAIAAIADYEHTVRPWQAVLLHFVPIVNLWWVLRWPAAIAEFVNSRCGTKVIRGWAAGTMMLLGAVLFQLGAAVLGVLFLYAAAGYVARGMRRAFNDPTPP